MLAGYMDKFEEQLRLRLPNLAAHFEVSIECIYFAAFFLFFFCVVCWTYGF